MAIGAGGDQGIWKLVTGGFPYGIGFTVIALMLRYAPEFLRDLLKARIGDHETREKAIGDREREANTWRDVEIARLRAETVTLHNACERNADMWRAWYYRCLEMHIRNGGKPEDMPAIDSLTRISSEGPK